MFEYFTGRQCFHRKTKRINTELQEFEDFPQFIYLYVLFLSCKISLARFFTAIIFKNKNQLRFELISRNFWFGITEC